MGEVNTAWGGNGWYISIAGTSGEVKAVYGRYGNYHYSSAAGQVSAGTWYHLVLTTTPNASGWDVQPWLDGASGVAGGNTSTLSDDNTERSTNIGRRGIGIDAYQDYFDGEIAEVAIWNATLTAAEIASLAKGYSPLLVRSGALSMYVPLVRDNDQDIVGGRSFTAYNTPTISPHPRVLYPARVHNLDLAPAASSARRAMMHYKRL